MKFISKRAIGVIKNLLIIFKDQILIKNKVNSKDKYFNYKKLEYYKKNYILPNYCKKNKLYKLFSSNYQQIKQNHASITTLTSNDNSDLKLFKFNMVNITKKKQSVNFPKSLVLRLLYILIFDY